MVVTLESMMINSAGIPRPSSSRKAVGLASPVVMPEIAPTNMNDAAPANEPISVPQLEAPLLFA